MQSEIFMLFCVLNLCPNNITPCPRYFVFSTLRRTHQIDKYYRKVHSLHRPGSLVIFTHKAHFPTPLSVCPLQSKFKHIWINSFLCCTVVCSSVSVNVPIFWFQHNFLCAFIRHSKFRCEIFCCVDPWSVCVALTMDCLNWMRQWR